MSPSDTTPLLAGRHPNTLDNPPRRNRTSLPNATHPNSTVNNLPSNPNSNSNSNSNGNGNRHWSEETEDIPGVGTADPNLYGHQNTGAGYRRRGRQAITPPYTSDLDAERFSGQDRPTGIRRLFYGCCCFPCRRAYHSFQSKYSKTEKYAMAVASVCFLLAVAVLCAYVRALEELPASGKNGICTSRECTIVSADILRDLKPEVDPCTDFYSFTCGGWMDRVAIPDDKSNIAYFSLLKKQNQEVIRAILSPETTLRGKDDASKRNLIKLQSLYESCMDEKKLTTVGVKPLADLVQKLIKTFPVPSSVLDTVNPANIDTLKQLNVWTSQQQSLQVMRRPVGIQRLQRPQDEDDLDFEMVEKKSKHREKMPIDTDEQLQQDIPQQFNVFLPIDLRKRQQSAFAMAEREQLALAITQLAWVGVSGLVDFDVDSDPKNPDVNVFKMGENGLGLPSKEYYNEDKIVAVYQNTVAEMFAVILGNDSTSTPTPPSSTEGPIVWAEVAKNVVEFEKLLAAISNDPEDLDNSEFSYNPRSLAQITELIPSIDWALVLEKLLTPGFKVPDPIIVSSPEYLQKLNALLKETPALTLQNYFAWKLISRLSSELGVEYNKPMRRLRAALQGVSEDLVTPRWETCVDVVDNALGAMAGHFFVEKAFKGDSKDAADSIVSSLRTAFVKGLSRLEWLDRDTRLNATEKVDKLVQKIGYSVDSPDVRSSESLEEYFKDLGIDRVDFFGNQIRARAWNTDFALRQLGKPVDKARWFMSPQTVNAYYNPTGNEIVFPAGILQQPFFHNDNPEYLNFGGIGVVAGHELSRHALAYSGKNLR
ncbi:hypothetical protein BGZ94_007342 [Podila epigama]|nr:hypothetical protein BGZ94_007342 [Podila epigama]